jgi:hypothetical protein
MKCPKCNTEMKYNEGEDEGSGDTLNWYAFWWCAKCNTCINDVDERFEFPVE